MADTAVAVTAGSGTNIDTRTEATNGNHRQVVVLGDPSTNAGVAPVDGTAGLKVDLGTDNDVTVTGTVTANLSATDNAVLDAIAASTAAIETAVEGTLTVTGGGSGVEYTQGDTDATIVGSAVMMEVAGDTLQPIQGTVADGLLVNLGANNDISGTVTANLSATDNAVLDAIEADTTTLVAKDFATEATLASVEGSVVDVANATTADDAGFTVATSRVMMNGFLFDDVAPDSVNEGDAGAGRMSANRNQYVQVRDAAGNERGLNIAADGSLAVTVASIPSHAVTATDLDIRNLTNTDVVTAELSAVDNAVLDTIAAKDFATQTTLSAINAKLVTGTDIGDVTINNASGAAAVNIQDGGNTITVDGTVGVSGTVTVGSHAVTNAGTFVTQENGALLTAAQLIDDTVFADDAAFTLSTSKGHVMAGVAVETDGTDPTSVSAEGDASAVRTDRNRRLLVNDMHPNSFVLFEDHTSAQTNNQLKAAPGAGLSIYITDVIFSNGATAGSIKLVEDEAGTPVQIGQTVYMGINGGAVMPFNTPKRLTANKSLGFTSTTVTTHSVEIHGYIAP